MQTVQLLIMVFIAIAVLVVIASVVNESRKDKKEILEIPEKEVYTKWNDSSNFIIAFIARYYKTSDKGTIRALSLALNRSETSITRKISRLRGIRTGKSPYSNASEREAISIVYDIDSDDAVDKLKESMYELKMSEIDQDNLQEYLVTATLSSEWIGKSNN